jgi:putative PIG3 family NAD(P)H quinone oxidoreductase
MKAIRVYADEPGRPMRWEDASDPLPGPGEVLVDIYAAALNRADLLQRAGGYPPPAGAPDILGLDMAGRVAALGQGVVGWQPGDRVCALLGGGGYAERVAVPREMLMPIPAGWSFEQAAALPEVYLTAFVNLFMEAGFQAGETVLMHGGASGVGTAVIQLGKAAGGRVLVTAGSEDKLARCRELGADLAINYRVDDWLVRAREFTQGAGVDVIVDMVGADYFERNLSLLRPRGRLVFIATLSGTRVELSLGQLMSRRLRLIGSVLRSRSLAEKVAIKQAFMERFWPMLEAGTIQPVVDSVYPIAEVEAAHRRMAENRNLGKIVLKIR